MGDAGAAAGKPAVPLHRVVGGLRQRTDALLVCPYIREVDGFSFSKKGSRVEARFTVHTVYEEFTQKTEVSIR